MSNFLAIATVTATLTNVLQAAISADVSGSKVTRTPPDSQPGVIRPASVNLYLYQVTPNPAYRNADLPTRRNGTVVTRPQAALDLHYLISFYGDDKTYEPQRLLGTVVRTLHEQPCLTRPDIRNAVLDPPFNDPSNPSNLADQVELVRFAPTSLSLEELSKLWSIMLQAPYVLSVMYRASVVLIDGQETARPSLPVRIPNIYVSPFRYPSVDGVISNDGPDKPILAGGTILITGHQLQGQGTLVRVGGQNVTPATAADTAITAILPTNLQAGPQGLQIVQIAPPLTFPTAESSVATFVLRPAITATNVTATGITLAVNPVVGAGQRVLLLLNETTGTTPASFSFNPPPPEADTASLAISISGVKAGTYFIRLQIDGAESPVDLDPASPTFGPTVAVP
jgi:Pvc16 N-terminal domain